MFGLVIPICLLKKTNQVAEKTSERVIHVTPQKISLAHGIGLVRLGKLWRTLVKEKGLPQRARAVRFVRRAKPGQKELLTRIPARMQTWRRQNIVKIRIMQKVLNAARKRADYGRAARLG